MTLLTAGLVVLALTARTDTTVNVPQGTRLKLENFGGDIQVESWNRNAVHISAHHSRRSQVSIELSGKELLLEGDSERGGPVTIDWELKVPKWMSLDLSGVYSDISVSGTTGEIQAESVQGDITIVGGDKHVAASSVQGIVRVEGASGRVEVGGVNESVEVVDSNGDLQAESVNGDVRIRGGTLHAVEMSSVGGSLRFDSAFQKSGEYRFSTHNGDIYVAVPTGADLEVSVSTYQGSFEASFPVGTNSRRRHDFSFTLGEGDSQLELESFQGGIYLYRPGEKPSSESLEEARRLGRDARREYEKLKEKHKDSKSPGDEENEDPEEDP
jgi:DUF4097 and DUF4098 domain-containing protein YvlB